MQMLHGDNYHIFVVILRKIGTIIISWWKC